MPTYYDFIGWDNSDNHDKIWGVAVKNRRLGSPAYVFYGKRGKTLSVKEPLSRMGS